MVMFNKGIMEESSKKDTPHTLHDFIDFQFSKEVVKDHPRIIAIYNKLLPVLYGFAQYQGVYPVIQMVEDSKLLLELQLDYYGRIYKTKGLVNESKTKS
jgi:hypothetical protein